MSRTLVIAATALAVTLAGCSSGSDSTIAPAAQNSPPPVSGQSQPDLRASMEAQLGFPPKPDERTTQAYLADLKSIDPALVSSGDPAALVNRGRDQCRDLKVRPEKDWTAAANQRFTTPQAPEGLGAAAAARIITVVRTRLCPTF
ncbi:hypothetical protein GCM10010168_46430 [Actinoplanes ianthinogenes]|uniref:DUF732 domain-containing protein n=1 Tax=Actinoplanes ianthinogenes TaxID=122358 RepID=A0ABN6C8Y6_9ACTN|nr:hypothetical protein [Actinoplanes ianthinogenes]BCJ41059.1 hypothetical protein Aiant_17160 [Actinoplanes ianthinogenes]GGR23174.1 hypothetical protein GCM10010168_46430 [Actinoplanes ianthinogenes]